MDLILPDTASPVSGKLWSKQMNAWEKAGARHTTVYSSSHSRTPATQAWLSLNDPPPGYRTIRGYAGRPAQRGPGSSGARTKSRAKWWTGRPGSGRWSTAQAARQRRLRSESSAPIPYRGAADSPFLGFPGPPEAFPRLPRPVLSHTPGPTPPGSMNHKHHSFPSEAGEARVVFTWAACRSTHLHRGALWLDGSEDTPLSLSDSWRKEARLRQTNFCQ